MTENIKKLLEIVSGDAEAVKALNALKTVEEVIAFAKEKGVALTEADLQPKSSEVGDDELEAVAGGFCACPLGGGGSQGCICIFGGIGDNCGCILSGGGID